MAHISLYRKWRPQTFEEVVGQDHVTRTLSNAIKQDRISHAYLFSGARGTGKTTVAKILAKALNCEKGPTPIPCNECNICEEITNGSSVDVLEIDAASNRGIDEIRDLREKVHFAPTGTRTKVYIIDEVHMLTSEAFNALLKTLEEPPLHVIFVLATTEPHKVIPTIASRCQQFDFRRILISDIKERLKEIAQSEKIQIDEASLYLIAKSAQGSLRDAIGTLDQLSSFTRGKIELDDVISLLGAVDLELLFEITDIMVSKDASACIEFVDRLVESGRDIRQFTREFLEHLHYLFIVKNVDKPGEIVNTTLENLTRMQKQASQIEMFELVRTMDVLTKTLSDMRWNPDARLLLEMALIKLIKTEMDVSLEGLLARVEQLERRLSQSEVEKLESQKSKVLSPQPEAKRLEAGVENDKHKGRGTKDKAEEKKEQGRRKKDEGKEQIVEESLGYAAQDKRAAKRGGKIDITKIKRIWPVVLDQVKKEKISTYALLLECQPVKLESQEITLSFNEGASFHCREIEKPQNLKLIRDAFRGILGSDFGISCILSEQINESEVETISDNENKSADEIEEILPKPHIVKLVQDSFEAEVVDETDFE